MLLEKKSHFWAYFLLINHIFENNEKAGLVMRSAFDIYIPMQDVAPKAVKNMNN